MLTLHCPPGQVYALTSFMRESGAEAVSVAELGYVFSQGQSALRQAGSGAVGFNVTMDAGLPIACSGHPASYHQLQPRCRG